MMHGEVDLVGLKPDP